MPSVSFSGIDKAPSRRVTYEASVCNVVLDVHVKQSEMHMSYCSTCTCRTALHVHLKQCYTPGKRAFLSEKDKVQYRATATILPEECFPHERGALTFIHGLVNNYCIILYDLSPSFSKNRGFFVSGSNLQN